jgi:hypothetical protein
MAEHRSDHAHQDAKLSADSFDQLTVLSMIGPNRAVAFNRGWGRECTLNAGIDQLFEPSTTALILKELGAAR